MRDVVIVDAVRTPIGRRNGGLSTCHSVDVLGTVQKALFDRTGVDPMEVGQVVGGCVGQVGMQSMNVTRTAWLTAGLPLEVPATTVDARPLEQGPLHGAQHVHAVAGRQATIPAAHRCPHRIHDHYVTHGSLLSPAASLGGVFVLG